MFKNVASQKLQVFAFDTTTGAAKTGDAANITAYVAKDYGSVTVLGDTSATEMDATNAKGWYLFDLTQGETNADNLLFTAKSTTANISIVGQVVYTLPPNFTAASIDSNGRLDVIKVAGTTQTARDIGASVLLSTGTGTGQLDFTSGVVKANATQWLGGTIPAVNVTGVPLVDAKYLLGTIFSTPATAGIIDVNLKNIANAAVSTSTAQLGVNVVNNAGSAITSASGIQEVKVASIAANAVTAAAIADAAIDRATFAADTGLQPIRSNTATAGSGTTITLDASASAVDSFYINDIILLTGGTGVGQARFISAYVGATKVATVATWATNPDNTTTFAILPFDAVAGASAPTAAQVATAVWQDTTSGDFTTSGSIGKSLFTSGAIPGAAGGHFIAGTNAATTVAITGNITGNLSGSVGSVTGAVGSVTGAVGSIATGGIAAASFAAGAIDAAAIASNAIAAAKIATGAITNAKFAAGAIDAAAIADGAIDAATFASGAIDATAIAADAIGSSEFSTAAANKIADAMLDRNMATGTDSGSTTVRTMRQALRFLRNKWTISGTTLSVKAEDDSTESWSSTLTTDGAATPVTASDPAGP